SAPSGWAFADGSVLPIIDHETLFNLIGTTYGGDGETTFALPDLRGRVAVGFGQGPELSPYEIGQQAGVESVALTVAQIPAHAHTFTPHIPGDYNLNGTVDTADYVVWRKTDGTPESYNIWRTHFGESIGGGAAASGSDSVAVPEPHSLSLWVLALVGLLAVPPASRAAKIRC
ncbi:MAG: tail fiber protein, partial [Planctomycetes bacterium]|nr:tail fiber protein [Planctomycetota bacterium]